MIRSTAILLIIVTAIWGQSLPESICISRLSNPEIDELLREISQKPLTITERMNYFSQIFLGVPYQGNCTGDGPYALYENDPLVNFHATNCMVFCEHVLALSISNSWDNFFNNLQQIRYQNGVIGMRSRNHYTMADWLPENSWLLEDLSQQIGSSKTITVRRTISHWTFFRQKGITDLRYTKPDREISINVIPKEMLSTIKNKIKPADILVLIYANKPNIFAAHMVMAAQKNRQLLIREASASQKTTIETDYDKWAKEQQSSDRFLGVSILRVRDDLNQPGKVILPWEIQQLKTVKK